jgi:hypothetical protein
MSLAVLANHMASKGRGPDSMLVHMSPREVRGLQALAHANGGSLTINPSTGLPEAGFLESMLPTIIGIALAPATGGASLGLTEAWQTAALVGGAQALRTGNIGKGLQAGLQAYGGANLAGNVANLGSNALSEGTTLAANEAGRAAGIDAVASTAATPGIDISDVEAAQRTAIDEGSMAAKGPSSYEKLSAGAESVADSPMKFLKANATPLAMAVGPAIFAGANTKGNMPQTVTQPGRITPYGFDPYTGTYTAASPYETVAKKAADGGLMNLAYNNSSGGMFDFTKDGSNEPVVRSMARGGVAHYEDGGPVFVADSSMDEGGIYLNPSQLATYAGGRYAPAAPAPAPAAPTAPSEASAQYFANLINPNATPSAPTGQPVATTQALNLNSPAALLNALQNGTISQTDLVNNGYKITPPAVNPYTSYTNQEFGNFFADPKNAAVLQTPGGLAAAISQYKADPTAVNSYLQQNAGTLGLSGGDVFQIQAGKGVQGVYDQMDKWVADNPNATGAQIQAALKASSLNDKDVQNYFNRANEKFGKNEATGKAFTGAGDIYQIGQGKGFSDVKTNITSWIATHPTATLADAQNAMSAGGINELDVIRATGKTSAEYYAKVKEDVATGKVPEPPKPVAGALASSPAPAPAPSAATGAPLPVQPVGAGSNPVIAKPNPFETATNLPPGVSGAGVTTVNPNGTITTRPDLNLGLKDVRDKYTTGGGSLGFIPPVPKTLDEFNAKYGLKKPSGSKQSLDYLTSKTPYSPTPYTPTGEVMKPYSESVLGTPIASSKKMYLYDQASQQYKINPDYAIPTYDKDGKKSYGVTNKEVADYVATKPSSTDLYTWMTTNNLSPEQVAQASGIPTTDIYKKFSGAKALTDDTGKIDPTKVSDQATADEKTNFDATAYLKANPDVQAELNTGKANFGTKDDPAAAAWEHYQRYGKTENRAYTKKAAGGGLAALTMARGGTAHQPFFSKSTGKFSHKPPQIYANGGIAQFDLGGYSDGGRLLRGPGDGVSDSIPATIAGKQPARLADGEFVVPARIVSELGNGSTEAGARKLYAMMDRVQAARKGSIGKGKVANNSRADKYLPA